MTVLWIIIPLMVAGVLIATVPVLWGSVRNNRALRRGEIETPESARQEAEFWHRMLGRRRGRHVVTTPPLLTDDEIARTGAQPQDGRSIDGESVWITPR